MLLGALAGCVILSSAAAAQPTESAASIAANEQLPPPAVRELFSLLADPTVQQWLERQRAAERAAQPSPEPSDAVASAYLSTRLSAIRDHIATLVAAGPRLPDEFRRVGAVLKGEMQRNRGLGVLLLATFMGLGLGAEWLLRRATAEVRRRTAELRLDTVGGRLRAAAARFFLGVAQLTAFALASVGAFVAFEWPPLLRQGVLGYLLAFLAVRITFVLCRFLLAPDDERYRIAPMNSAAARFWSRRFVAFAAWLAFGWVTVNLLGALGMSLEARRLVAYCLGLGLLAIGLEAVWRAPPSRAETQFSRRLRSSLLSMLLVLLWALWVASAMPTFWLVLILAALPLLLRTLRRSMDHVLRPAGAAHAAEGPSSVLAVGVERGARAALMISAALLLARAWDIDLTALAAQDTAFTRLVRGAVNAVIIVLLADVAWHMLRAAIDRRVAEARDLGAPNSDEARQRARLRTLLPIARNVLSIVLVAMAAMMALSAMGVEIGPLIAGAGVVGVAIGFGAQTLVKDVISGMFYLVDDAFRVGEYIQSGDYKGTVESFSLRSIKLRHHRGPLYTVPFGMLGAVQNMSRDWVIDKLEVGVTYDSDIEKARKLIKQIGRELAQDPELAPNIIEPLKMQGVEQFGDFSVRLRMKVTTLPGQQFVIRRKAYAMLKKAFDANGIKFAVPTVQVAGESETASPAAVARKGLDVIQPATPAAE
jgi:small-conductance mechanosensitive channel